MTTAEIGDTVKYVVIISKLTLGLTAGLLASLLLVDTGVALETDFESVSFLFQQTGFCPVNTDLSNATEVDPNNQWAFELTVSNVVTGSDDTPGCPGLRDCQAVIEVRGGTIGGNIPAGWNVATQIGYENPILTDISGGTTFSVTVDNWRADCGQPSQSYSAEGIQPNGNPISGSHVSMSIDCGNCSASS